MGSYSCTAMKSGLLWSTVLALVAMLVYLALDVMTFLGEWRLNDPNWRHDDTCTLIGGDMVQGAEDLAIWKNGVAIVSAGDLHTAFTQDPALTQNTGAFAVDITKPGEPRIRQLELVDFPNTTRFVGHGMHISNTSNRAYFVVHGDYATQMSFIDAFEI